MKFAILILLMFGFDAFADRVDGGVAFEVALGTGSATIQNPDDTKAGYKLLGINARGVLPLIESDNFNTVLTGGGRFLDLTNTANSSAQKEVGNMIGPGAGLRLRAYKFFVAYEYDVMHSRLYTIGNNSHSIEFTMPLSTLEAGVVIPFKQLSVSFSYTRSSGKVPKSGSGLTKDVPYTDQIYWLQLTYTTGASFQKFLGFLF